MIATSLKRVQNIQEGFKEEIETQYEVALFNLKGIETGSFKDTEYETYLQKVIECFDSNKDILTATPERLEVHKGVLGVMPIIAGKEEIRILVKKEIIKALGYDSLRKSFYARYFAEIGLKACVYCNSQLTVSVKLVSGKYSGRFDVDHYHSKDDFPWLSICLFNLYPACTPCNRFKSNKTVDFKLYSDDKSALEKSIYEFKLDPYAKAKYLMTKDISDIKYWFENGGQKHSDFHESFKINEIYQTQLDVVEELFLKSQIYDGTYRKVLQNNFSKLGISHVNINRIILGNYVKESDMHKRPLSKFMYDIAKQLKIIP